MRHLSQFALLVLLATPLTAQSEEASTTRPLRNGFHLYETALSAGYNDISSQLLTGNTANLYSPYSLAASLSAGYSHVGTLSGLEISYTPSLLTRFNPSSRYQFNQAGRFRFAWRINPKWRMAVWGTGDDSRVEQYATGGSAMSSLTSAATSGGDPIQTLLYGGRRLQYGGHVAVTANPNTRWTITLDGAAFQTQTRRASGESESSPIFVPRSRYEQGTFSANYALTPRNWLGVQASTLFYHTGLGDYRSTMEMLTFSRSLTPRWVASLQGGAGQSTALSTQARTQSGVSLVGGAGLAYQGLQHGFNVAFLRARGDSSGMAAEATTTEEIAWKFHPRGQFWEFHTALRRRTLAGGIWGDGENWEVNSGLTRMWGRRMTSNFEYGYIRTTLGASATTLSGHFARMTIVFIPLFEEARNPREALGPARPAPLPGER